MCIAQYINEIILITNFNNKDFSLLRNTPRPRNPYVPDISEIPCSYATFIFDFLPGQFSRTVPKCKDYVLLPALVARLSYCGYSNL